MIDGNKKLDEKIKKIFSVRENNIIITKIGILTAHTYMYNYQVARWRYSAEKKN